MSDTKFTPGKWKVVQEDSHKFHEKTGEKTEFSRYWVRDENDSSITLFSNEYSHYPSPRDCAHLVAAAPELYELLAEYVHTMSQTKMASLDYHMQFNYRAHDLLAKARGESNG